MKVAAAYEDRFGADVRDVSHPELARRAGLPDWPGFDLLSSHPEGHRRNIEVKGRARSGNVEISDNEWAAACNRRDDYWLYVVFDCATPHPRLVRVRDPFGKLLRQQPRRSHIHGQRGCYHRGSGVTGRGDEMGATHVTVAIRNPAEPDRTLGRSLPRRHGRDRLPRAQAMPGIHRPCAQRTEDIRVGRRQRNPNGRHNGRR